MYDDGKCTQAWARGEGRGARGEGRGARGEGRGARGEGGARGEAHLLYPRVLLLDSYYGGWGLIDRSILSIDWILRFCSILCWIKINTHKKKEISTSRQRKNNVVIMSIFLLECKKGYKQNLVSK